MTMLSLTAGLTLLSSVAVCGNPRAVHNSAPSAPFSAWSTLSAETKKIFPAAAVGELRTGSPTVFVHRMAPLPGSIPTTVP